LLGTGKVHFVQASEQVDEWRDCRLLTDRSAATAANVWAGASACPPELTYESGPDDRGHFAELSAELIREKSYAIFGRQLKEHLYREETLQLLRCPVLDACSRAGETSDAFRARLAPVAAERLRAEREKLEQRYSPKLADMEMTIKRHQTGLRTQRWQFWAKLGNILWVIVETVLRAMGQGRRGRPRSAEVAFRQAATEHGQQATAQISVDQALQKKERLETEWKEQLQELEKQFEPSGLPIEPLSLSPRKPDIDVDQVALVWLPWRIDSGGSEESVY
jgi:hypothetical protein